ncbi:MAG: PA4642 family protein [Pseudomonadales bacterium]
MLKKDKAKVLDEVWTEDRVRSFLNLQSAEGVDPDFHMLLKAYQSMRDSDFELFVGFFQAAGRDVNAKNPAGQTLLEIAKQHRNSGEFVTVLSDAGAS